jgi:hypothetical protein
MTVLFLAILLLQAAPDSTRSRSVESDYWLAISLIPHTHTSAEPDLTVPLTSALLNLPKGKSLGRSKPATNA